MQFIKLIHDSNFYFFGSPTNQHHLISPEIVELILFFFTKTVL